MERIWSVSAKLIPMPSTLSVVNMNDSSWTNATACPFVIIYIWLRMWQPLEICHVFRQQDILCYVSIRALCGFTLFSKNLLFQDSLMFDFDFDVFMQTYSSAADVVIYLQPRGWLYGWSHNSCYYFPGKCLLCSQPLRLFCDDIWWLQ